MNLDSSRIQAQKGTPYAIGYAIGRQLGAKLEQNIARYLREFGDASAKFVIDWARLHTAALSWLQSLPQRFQDEFAGLAAGSAIPLQRLAEWFFIEQCATLQCSSVLCLVNGQVWVARNNDTIAPGMWGYVSIREVTGRIPTITFGREGDVFAPTGINQERLWLHYHYLPAVDTLQSDQPHLPPYVVMIEALETCRSLQELEVLLGQIQRSDGMLLFAVDGRTNDLAIFECGHRVHYKREPVDGILVGTNHYCTCPDPDGPLAETPLSTLGRFRRLEQLVEPLRTQTAPTLPDTLIQVLADDAIERRDATFATAYANVACPQSGDLWYTFGGYPAASQGNWQRLDWPW